MRVVNNRKELVTLQKVMLFKVKKNDILVNVKCVDEIVPSI